MTYATEAVLEFADFTVHTLTSGVHAAIAKRGSGAVANAGIIDLGDRTLVFDTFMCLPAARDLQQAAIQLTGRPATYVVNSHPHPDHIHGNIVFGDEVTIISSTTTRADLLTSGSRFLAETRRDVTGGLRHAEAQLAAATDEAQRAAAQGMIRYFQTFLTGLPAEADLRYPTLTYERKLTLTGSARSVELIAVGGGHSPCDSILWLPAERIAFTADVVVNGGQATLFYGDPEEWLRILAEIDRLEPLLIVPGHGRLEPAASTAPVRQYITDMLALAARAKAEGLSVEQIAIPEAYKQLPPPRLFAQNMAYLLRR
jgi:cyclase